MLPGFAVMSRSEDSENIENSEEIEDSGLVEFMDPEDIGKPRVHLCGRFLSLIHI